MNLATRCPACGTVFRVVQDQLRVSEGWVRCGRCDEVFSALKALFDLDRGTPPPLADAPRADVAAPRPEPEHDATNATTVIPREEPAVPLPLVRPSNEAQPFGAPAFAAPPTPNRTEPPAAEPAPVAPTAPIAPAPTSGWPSASQPASMPSAGPLASQGAAQTLPGAQASSSALAAAGAGHPGAYGGVLHTEPAGQPATIKTRTDAPSEPRLINTQHRMHDDLAIDMVQASDDEGDSPAFVVHAQSRARWRRSAARPLLIAVAALLALLLAAQAAFEYRTPLVAALPALRAPMEKLCDAVGCALPSPMRLAQLTVDSAALARPDAGGVNRLAMTIRNRGASAVAVPAIELSLSNEQGQVVIRRVFLPQEYGARQPAIAPHADLPVQLPLAVADAGVSGFSVEIFYP